MQVEKTYASQFSPRSVHARGEWTVMNDDTMMVNPPGTTEARERLSASVSSVWYLNHISQT
jgi:hypothetical protein